MSWHRIPVVMMVVALQLMCVELAACVKLHPDNIHYVLSGVLVFGNGRAVSFADALQWRVFTQGNEVAWYDWGAEQIHHPLSSPSQDGPAR